MRRLLPVGHGVRGDARGPEPSIDQSVTGPYIGIERLSPYGRRDEESTALRGCRMSPRRGRSTIGARRRTRLAESTSSEESAVHIEPFFVEQWMNAHETTATWNIAETCVHSLTLERVAGAERRRRRRAASPARDLAGLRGHRGLAAAARRHRGAVRRAHRPRQRAHRQRRDRRQLPRPLRAGRARDDAWSACSPPTSSSSRCRSRSAPRCTSCACARQDGYLPDVGGDPRGGRRDAPRSSSSTTPTTRPARSSTSRCCGEIVEVAREHDAWLFCDEVYRRLEHEPGTTAPSVADLYEKGVSSGSMSKSYSLAGLRTGWVAGPAEVMRALPRRARLHDHQRRRARRRARGGGARASRRGARAQPRHRARQPRRRGRLDRAGAAPAVRAPARRHHRPRPLRPRRPVRRTSARGCSTSTAPSSCPASPSARSTPSASATRALATCSRAGSRPSPGTCARSTPEAPYDERPGASRRPASAAPP